MQYKDHADTPKNSDYRSFGFWFFPFFFEYSHFMIKLQFYESSAYRLVSLMQKPGAKWLAYPSGTTVLWRLSVQSCCWSST